MSLLLKKSWHPALMKNQARVYDAEQSEIAERKKTAARLQEIKEERAKEALQADLEKAGGKPRLNRVDWMYEGPSDGQNGTSEELEGFLLGKRRIDNLLTRGSEQEALKKQVGPGPDLAMMAPKLNERDTAAKLREDPLLAIKRKEQEAYEAMVNDPIRRQQLLASMGKAEEKPSSSRKKEDRHSRRHKHRSDSRDRENRHRRHHHHRRSDSRDREREDDLSGDRRHRGSRRSDSRDRSTSRDRYESGSGRRSRHQERPGRERSESPERSRDHGRSRRDRSRSPRRSSYDDQEDRPKRRRDYEEEPPRGGKRQYKGPSNYDDDRRDARGGRYNNNNNNNNDRRRNDRYGGGNDGSGSNGSASASGSSNTAAVDAEERARKLAAMQANASGLDDDRAKRLAALEEKERLAREADDKAREKSGKYGDQEFAHGLRRQLLK